MSDENNLLTVANAEPGRRDDPLAFSPDQETALWIKIIREARLLFGRAAAREIWQRSPLDTLSGIDDSAPDDDDIDRILDFLRTNLIPTQTTADLTSKGIRREPLNAADYFLIADNHPWIDNLFRASPWSSPARRRRLLRGIPGAFAVRNRKTFPGASPGKQRSTAIPANALLPNAD